MSSRYQLTTTMHSNGYEVYGRNMIDSFLKRWPSFVNLVVYTEGFSLDQNQANDERIVERDLLECSPELVAFKNRHANNPRANGFVNEGQKDPDFKFDAVRFSHKVMALYHAVNNRLPGADAVVWVDADTVTHAPIPVKLMEKNFPLDTGVGIYYLGRKEQYTECGWVVYNCLNPHMKDFWERFSNQYRKDKLLNQTEWHDSFIFDRVRETMEREFNMVNSNITPEYVKGHPFIDCFLGDYMDHLKGPKRKVAGRSRKNESKTSKASYWK